MSSIPPTSEPQTSPLRSSYAGDPDMVELIELFVGELPKRVEVISGAFRGKEFETLCRISHQLKGAGAGYGFAPIGQAAARVEEHLKALGPQADFEQVRQEVESLIAVCNRAVK